MYSVGMGYVVFWGFRLMHRITRTCNVLHDFQPEIKKKKKKKKIGGENPSSTV